MNLNYLVIPEYKDVKNETKQRKPAVVWGVLKALTGTDCKSSQGPKLEQFEQQNKGSCTELLSKV